MRRQISGRFYLLMAVTIFGAANAITRKLTEVGADNLINGRNPVSFCNILFVGNLCALLLLSIIYAREWRISLLKQIHWRQWLNLTIVAILSGALVPSLIFLALSITRVNNVILLSQIDIPLVLIFSVLFLHESINFWVVIGAIFSFIGVALTLLFQFPQNETVSMLMGIEIGQGELLTLFAAFIQAISNVISKVSLQRVSLGVFSVFRMLIGTIVFFTTTIILLGPSHFVDVTSPFLWQWMLVYSAIIVVAGQLFWFKGLKQSRVSEVSLATAFNPLIGIIAAYLILGEVPTNSQYLGGSVIFLGIILNQIGIYHLNQTAIKPKTTAKELTEQLYKGM